MSRDDWLNVCTDMLLICANSFDSSIARFSTYYYSSCLYTARHFVSSRGRYRERECTNVPVSTDDYSYVHDFDSKLSYDQFKFVQKYLTRRQWGIVYDMYARKYTLDQCAKARGITREAVRVCCKSALVKLKPLLSIRKLKDK